MITCNNEAIRHCGKHAKNFLKLLNYEDDLYRECIYNSERGIVIGIEYNFTFEDIYLIVYNPESETFVYPLINDASLRFV